MRSEKMVETTAAQLAADGVPTLLYGPPGSGKTMIGNRVPRYMPPLRMDEKALLEDIYASARLPPPQQRPFRAPHHTVSRAGMGGTPKHPTGECSLAHLGVLFLDELPEFSAQTLWPVQEATKTGFVRHGAAIMPAGFLLLAAANPCLCGWAGSTRRACTCRPEALARYQERLSLMQATLGLRTYIVTEALMYPAPSACPVRRAD